MPIFDISEEGQGREITNGDAKTAMEQMAEYGIEVEEVAIPHYELGVKGADLQGLVLRKSVCLGLIISDTNFARAEITETDMAGCRIKDTILDNAVFTDAVFDGSEIQIVSAENCLFGAGCSFRGTRFFGDLSGVTFQGACLEGCNMRNVTAPPMAILGGCHTAGMQMRTGDVDQIQLDLGQQHIISRLLVEWALGKADIPAARDAALVGVLENSCAAILDSDEIYGSKDFRMAAFGRMQLHLETVGGDVGDEMRASMEAVLNVF